MNRRNFIRDIALSIAMTLVPRVLQPIDSNIIEEDSNNGIYWYIYTYGSNTEYTKGSFTLNDLNQIAINYYNK